MARQDRRRRRQHARPHPRRRRPDGDAAGQAGLLPEAAGPLALRSPPDARDRRRDEGRDPDGQPGDVAPRLPRGRRADPLGRRRRRSARSTSGRTGRSSTGSSRPTSSPGPRRCPIPEHVAWDLFLGPAPERPYNPVYHPHDWRGWWDFGTGALGDMACHTANLPSWR